MCDVLELSELSTKIGAQRRNGNIPAVYIRHSECLNTLRTFARYLREDDFHFREVFLTLSGMKILSENLLPLLKSYPDDEELAYHAVTIAAYLTMPVDVKTHDVQRQLEYVFQAKKCILAAHYLPQFACLFIDHLQSLPHVNLNRMNILLEFLRNMLLVSHHNSASRTEEENRIHEQVLEQLKESDLFTVLIILCQHAQHPLLSALSPLLIEIIHCILKQFQVESIVQSTAPHTKEHQEKNKMTFRHSGQQSKRQLSRRQLTGGFVVKHCEENNGSQLIRMREYTTKKTSVQNKRTHEKMITSNSSFIVKEFMAEFLKNGYNPLMHGMQGLLSTVDRSTYNNYMTICSFCLKYASLLYETSKEAKDEEWFDYVSLTGGWETYKRALELYIGQFMEKDYALQASALSLVKELLFLFSTAYLSGSDENKQAANRLQRRILHDDRKESGLLSVLGKGIKSFSFKKHSALYGQNLAEAVHVTLKMYKSLNAQENGNLQVKVKKRRSKKTSEETPEEYEDPTSEKYYDMSKRVKQELAHPKVITFYMTSLLKDYWKNSDFLNHVIISFLKRVCSKDQMDLAPMLYQLSFLRIIQKIMEDPVVSSSSRFSELHCFCVTFCRNMFARISPSEMFVNLADGDPSLQEEETNLSNSCGKMLFLEMLVSKDMKSAINIRQQYRQKSAIAFEKSTEDEQQSRNIHLSTYAWSETSEELEEDVVSCAEEQLTKLTVDDLQDKDLEMQKRPKISHE